MMALLWIVEGRSNLDVCEEVEGKGGMKLVPIRIDSAKKLWFEVHVLKTVDDVVLSLAAGIGGFI